MPKPVHGLTRIMFRRSVFVWLLLLSSLGAVPSLAQDGKSLLAEVQKRVSAGDFSAETVRLLRLARDRANHAGDLRTLLYTAEPFLQFRDAGHRAVLAQGGGSKLSSLADWEALTSYEAAFEHAQRLRSKDPARALEAVREVMADQDRLTRYQLSDDVRQGLKFDEDMGKRLIQQWAKESQPGSRSTRNRWSFITKTATIGFASNFREIRTRTAT